MCTSSLLQIKLPYIYLVLSYSVGFKAPRELWNPPSKAVLVNVTGLADRVNVTAHKTELIFTGLGQDKVSEILTLRID